MSVDPVPFGIFMETVAKVMKENSSDGNLSIKETISIVEMATQYSAYWNVKYLFSPFVSPDTVAKEEWQKYQALVLKLIDSITDKVPEVRGNLISSKELTEAKFVADWNIEFYKSRPIQKKFKNFLGITAKYFNKLGFRSLAIKLVNLQLFPAWTVQRNSK